MYISLVIMGILFLVYFMFSFSAVLLFYFPTQLDKGVERRLKKMKIQQSTSNK